jgi:magnesium chelatase subunit I
VWARVCDLQQAVSAVSGKVELVLEGEQEGALNVARALLGKGVKALFSQRLPDAFKPRRSRRAQAAGSEPEEPPAASEYRPILDWFSSGHSIEISDDMPHAEYARALAHVKGLQSIATKYLDPVGPEETTIAMELVLEGLHQHSMVSRERSDGRTTAYRDMLKTMLGGLDD